jgi:hypothetical protein
MLKAIDIQSIYTGHVNQASQEKQQRVNNIAADIIGDYAAAAATGQRAHFVKESDIPSNIKYKVIDALIMAGFSVKHRYINGISKLEVRF